MDIQKSKRNFYKYVDMNNKKETIHALVGYIEILEKAIMEKDEYIARLEGNNV